MKRAARADPIAVALDKARELVDEAKRLADKRNSEEFRAAVKAAQAGLDNARALLAQMVEAAGKT
jgi:hypothetical protein